MEETEPIIESRFPHTYYKDNPQMKKLKHKVSEDKKNIVDPTTEQSGRFPRIKEKNTE